MGEILPWLSDLLVSGGIWILFVVCVLETAFFLGLVIPSGPLIVLASFLAMRGVFSPVAVVVAVVVGGIVGDQIGYLLGRYSRDRFRPMGGRIGSVWRVAEQRTSLLFVQHSMMSITIGRTISFVRTMIPWFAGRSRITYRRFLVYDGLGILAWAAFFLGTGFLAGEGWRIAADRVGVGGAVAAVVLLLAAVVLALQIRKRRRSFRG